MASKESLTIRETLAAHLPFLSFFYLKNDLTIFKLTEKKFYEHTIKAQVVGHPELTKTISFDEMVYQLSSHDLNEIASLIRRIQQVESIE